MSRAIQNIDIKEVRISEIIELLENVELPTEDLNPTQSIFLGAFKSEVLIACIGLEKIGEFGLLRSLAVRTDFRGKGLAVELTKAVLSEARKKSIDRVYLLTTDAESFFQGLGFITIKKKEAPESVKRTKQYSEICSDFAVVMQINL